MGISNFAMLEKKTCELHLQNIFSGGHMAQTPPLTPAVCIADFRSSMQCTQTSQTRTHACTKQCTSKTHHASVTSVCHIFDGFIVPCFIICKHRQDALEARVRCLGCQPPVVLLPVLLHFQQVFQHSHVYSAVRSQTLGNPLAALNRTADQARGHSGSQTRGQAQHCEMNKASTERHAPVRLSKGDLCGAWQENYSLLGDVLLLRYHL